MRVEYLDRDMSSDNPLSKDSFPPPPLPQVFQISFFFSAIESSKKRRSSARSQVLVNFSMANGPRFWSRS